MKTEEKTTAKALLVDDDEASNFIHKLLLNRSGVVNQIDTALNGQEAFTLLSDCLEHLDNEHCWPDYIFLDLNMPVMNGWEFLNKLNSLIDKAKHLPKIYLLTSSANPDDEVRAQQIPSVTQFLKKPLTLDLLSQIAEQD